MREQLVERRRRRLHRVVQLRQLLDRLEQLGEQQHDGDDRADRDVAAVDEPAADADRQAGREDAERLDQPEVPRRHPHAVHVRPVQRPVRRDELTGLLRLLGVRLDRRARPAMPSWSADRFCPIRSRTSRYAAFESRWNLREAMMMIGITSSAAIVSCHDRLEHQDEREHDQEHARPRTAAGPTGRVRPSTRCRRSSARSARRTCCGRRTPSDWRLDVVERPGRAGAAGTPRRPG